MATIIGNNRNNSLSGTNSSDTILGRDGNDVIDGRSGNDRINGGSGNDQILGGSGNDRIDGGRGNDQILGGDGNDIVDGGSGNDFVDGGSGNDIIDGGSGNDQVLGGSGNDIVDGGSGNDIVDGGSGNDIVDGGSGNDQVLGGSGNDIVDGGSGNDFVDGGSGADQLTGGSGSDRFIFLSASDSPAASGWDRITDFNQGRDKIDLAAFRNISSDLDLIWRGEDPAVAGPWGVWYHNDTTSTFVLADTSGDGIADLKIELRNTPGLNLVVTDFIGVANAPVIDTPPVNDAPVLTGDLAATVDEGARYTINTTDLNFTDPDDNAAGVTFTVTDSVNGKVQVGGSDVTSFTGTQLANGEVQFLHDGSETLAASFKVSVEDGNEDTSTPNQSTFNLTVNPVNDAPLAVSDTIAATEDTPVTYSAAQLLVNDTDVDSATLTVASVASGSGGTAVLEADGSISFTPDADFNGAASFSYIATDGALNSSSATVTVNVAAVNDAPAANPDTLTATEDTPVTYIAAQLLSNDTDVDSATLTIASVTSGSGGTAVLEADGSVTFTPDADFSGAASFSYIASDGTSLSSSAAATINVAAVNDAPAAAPVTLASIAEDSGARNITSAELLTGVTDVDGPGATITSLTIGTGNGTLVNNNNGSWSYTPALNDDTLVTFNYTVSDGSLSASATASLDITPVNDAPVTVADNATVDEGGTVTVLASLAASVLANDTDAESDPLTAILVTGPTHGSLTLNTDGTFSYTHDGSETTSDSFTYKADDGTSPSNSATVTVNVAAVNDAPVTTADSASTDEDTQVTGTVVDNTTDADDDVSTELTYSVVGDTPTGLTFNADGSYEFNPNGAFEGLGSGESDTVTFTYQADDGTIDSNVSTVTITVNGANDAPMITSNGGGVSADVSIVEKATAVTIVNAADVDNGNVLTLSIVGGDDMELFSIDPTTGVLKFNAAPVFELPADADEDNVYHVAVQVSDEYNATDIQSIAVTVTENQPPVAVADNVITNISRNQPVNIPEWALLANDSDPNLDPIDVLDVSATGGGTATHTLGTGTDGYVTFIPNNSDEGGAFDYRAMDVWGAVSSLSGVNVTLDRDGNLDGTLDNDILVVGLNSGAKRVVGIDGNDILVGGRGNDTLSGGVGDDTIDGGAGTDLLDFSEVSTSFSFTLGAGGSGSATVNGTDTYWNMEGVIGGSGNDSLTGNAGDNILQGGAGNDTFTGGEGVDLLDYSNNTTGFSFTLAEGGSGIATVDGTDTYQSMEGAVGGSGDDSLTGNTGDNILQGGAGSDVLTGGDGNDILTGGDGSDILTGGNGSDILAGGNDSDILTGGDGSDVFDYNSFADAGDTITDFSEAEGDKLELHDLLTSIGAPDHMTAFDDGYLKLTQAGDDTLVQIGDGSGSDDSFQTLATLSGVTLTSMDAFIL